MIAIILGIIISLISTIALIRLAKKGKFSEGFNFGAIMQTIRSIGWGRYIVAMIIYWVLSIAFFVVLELLNLIPVAGLFLYWLVYIIVIVPYILFSARYVTLVYEYAAPQPTGFTGTKLRKISLFPRFGKVFFPAVT